MLCVPPVLPKNKVKLGVCRVPVCLFFWGAGIFRISQFLNRKEGNDQESIQLPNTFCPRHQRERKTHLKQRYRNKKTTSRKQKRQFLFQKVGQTAIQNKKKNSPGHTAKTYNDRNSKPQQKPALERSVKNLTGDSNRSYVATTLAPSSAVVYTRHLFSLREGFLAHQCNISENIKIRRIQRWNDDEDSTARNNWNAEAKQNKHLAIRTKILTCRW